MYNVRVLLGGNIYIRRHSDKISQIYNPDGTFPTGGNDRLKLDAYQVRYLAMEAQAKWFEEL